MAGRGDRGEIEWFEEAENMVDYLSGKVIEVVAIIAGQNRCVCIEESLISQYRLKRLSKYP